MAIHIKPSHKGLLHKNLGVAKGKKIPASKLAKAANSESAAVRKRAVFAENAKHWNHKHKSSSERMSKGWHKKFSSAFGS